MYVVVSTSLDIAHAMGVFSRYISHPSIEHCNVVKWLLRYLRGTFSKCLHFGGSTTDLQGYFDLDLVGDIVTRQSITSYVLTVGRAEVIWVSRLQKVNSLFTIEVEFVVAIEEDQEMIWLQ